MAAEPRLPAEVQANLNDLLAKLDAKGSDFLSTHFASLPRRLGRQALEPVEETFESVDWRSHRRCDLGALHLLRAARLDDEALIALFGAGDFEERRMILKALQCLPMSPVGTRLLQEAHRQNDQQLFEAGFADGDLAARVLDDDDYNRFVLKAAFIDL
ncbi:MAG: EboA domain-containing protein, partial [Planctomycetes bacterium]|nr:EboA domain-containing protein [Planctomycetota bacterium]